MSPWIDSVVPEGSGFTIDNLPWGVYKNQQTEGRICVAIGEHVMDIYEWAQSWHDKKGYGEEFGYLVKEALMERTLNRFLELGKAQWVSVRMALQTALRNHNPMPGQEKADSLIRLIPMDQVDLLLPVHIGDYTDFYCSKEHATNVGSLFRGKDNALNPNWLHMPIGYHGRASSIIVSGGTLHRPRGQISTPEGPQFLPTKALDFELELACVLGKSTHLGQPVTLADADQHIFGYCLVNDCSARDIQKWECEAALLRDTGLLLFAAPAGGWAGITNFTHAEQIPAPLPYLCEDDGCRRTFDLRLGVKIQPGGSPHAYTVSEANLRDLYWTFSQMLAHHTAGGCNIRAGDIIASGTISSAGSGAQGCLLELTQSGREPLVLGSSWKRSWLEDGDTVSMHAICDNGSHRVGFGPCSVTFAPAL